MRTAEIALGTDALKLTQAVARYFYKLMAYKDEYEVARLYTNGDFQKKLASQFEGEYELKFHLAPPVFAKRDEETGHLVKKQFGPWMMKAFSVLAKFKFLRATALDPFARTDERKKEVALISEYEATIEEMLQSLSLKNIDLAVEIAEVPEHIRGFGHVKERHLQSAEAERESLLQRYRSGDTDVLAAQ